MKRLLVVLAVTCAGCSNDFRARLDKIGNDLQAMPCAQQARDNNRDLAYNEQLHQQQIETENAKMRQQVDAMYRRQNPGFRIQPRF